GMRSDKRRIPKKGTKPATTAAPPQPQTARKPSQPRENDWLAALADEAVKERHRRYVGPFAFEHKELFDDYLSVHHPDYRDLEERFRVATSTKRAARRRPKVDDFGGPEIDNLLYGDNDEEDSEDEVRVVGRNEVAEAVELLRQPTGGG